MNTASIPGRKTVNKGELLAEYIQPRAYGDIVRHQEIERIVGESRGTPRYYAAIGKAKKLLEESGRMIRLCGGGDYQILYPGDYAGAAAREINLAHKRVRHGGKILEKAPVNDMTSEERAMHNRVGDFYAVLEARMNGAAAEVKTLTKHKRHPLLETANTGQSA